jgi:hypothetical protein
LAAVPGEPLIVLPGAATDPLLPHGGGGKPVARRGFPETVRSGPMSPLDTLLDDADSSGVAAGPDRTAEVGLGASQRGRR